MIDKPAGWTSHDVVAKLRSVLDTPRIGHAGTLDPMATGVLVVGVGIATRLLTFISGTSKIYQATIRLGTETDTLDAEGEVVATHNMAPPGLERVQEAARGLTGEILQIPPMVSALRVDGRRLHELAREGTVVEREPRPVTVYRLEISPTDDPMLWGAVVECSSGTYVRSIAADLGSALGGGAHLSSLRRLSVGPFEIGESSPVESPVLMAPLEGVRHLEQIVIADDLVPRVRNGSVLPLDALSPGGSGPWSLVSVDGEFLAVYETHRAGTVKPSIVLPAVEHR